ncbi:MAG: DUF1073 domain-containing protein [Deltaproteobacteria bacterium]|jgi:phage-related protein (TIGR01555 family)|nr:DUF1073 domain-containing protein [Deltaproteobacteria bacterium]MBP6829486.1 DUF1073 domain-containing protein [Deltaproteobacteria bacterium]
MDFIDKVKAGLQRVDGWVNLVTGMGTSGRSKAVNFQAGDRLSDEMLEALYTGDPYANRICRVVPEEALRQGYRVKTGDSTEETAIGAHLDHWRVTSHLTAAWTWSRAFGGGVVFVGADDGRDPSEPLDEAAIRSVRFLVVADRRDLVPLTWCTDDESQRYGEPETYSFTRLSSGGASEVVIVHASRLIRFEGALTTRRRRTQLRGWGESELQRIYDVLSKFNGAWESTSTLLYQGSIGVLSMKNLFSMMAADKRDVLKTRLDMMDLAMSSTRNVLIDAEGESFTRTEVGALAGLAAVLDKFLLLLSGAAEIPVTILMGQSPAGLSATGESDVRWFYDRIKSAQTSTLTPCLLRLIRLLCLAKDGPTKGVVPAKLAVEFAPLWQMTPLELADLRQKQATTDGIYIDKQVVTADEVGASRFRPEGWSPETTIDLGAREAAMAADADAAQLTAGQGAPGADVDAAAGIVAKVAAREIPRDAGVALLAAQGMAPEAAEAVMGSAGVTFFTAPEAGHAAEMDAMKAENAKLKASNQGHQAYTARVIQKAKEGGVELGAFTSAAPTAVAEGDDLKPGDVVEVPADDPAPEPAAP